MSTRSSIVGTIVLLWRKVDTLCVIAAGAVLTLLGRVLRIA